MKKALLPLVIFLLLAMILAIGLTRDPREIPSPLIDKPAPEFDAPRLGALDQRLARKDMLGQVWLLNVWASWCVSCREEHPVLVQLSRKGVLPILGLNYKDRDDEAKRWLAQFGNPYQLSAVDADGRIGIDYGVYGVPETYLIDPQGVIVFKQIGPVTPEVLEKKILPLAQAAASPKR